MKRPKQSGGPDLADAPPAVLSNPRLIKVEMPFSSAVHKHRVIYTLPPPPAPNPPSGFLEGNISIFRLDKMLYLGNAQKNNHFVGRTL